MSQSDEDAELSAYLESQEEESNNRETIYRNRLKERFDATGVKATERERNIMWQWIIYEDIT
jgi:hypothetical protein